MSGSVILCLSWKCSVGTGMVSTHLCQDTSEDGFAAQQLEVVQHNFECFVKIAINSIDEYGFPAVLNTYKFFNKGNIFLNYWEPYKTC